MAVFLSGLAALVWGVADFLGGFATKKSATTWVSFLAAAAGLAMALIASPLISDLILVEIAWGCAAGVGGALGIGLLYHGLGVGPVGVVAPISAVVAAVVPFVVGVAFFSERPSAQALIGSALAFIAILMITFERTETRATKGIILMATGAGVGFGLFFVFLNFTSPDAGLWPLVGSKGTNTLLLGIVVAFQRTYRVSERTYRLPLLAGVLDMAANVAVLFALRTGPLSMVAVVTGLYPITTIVLARNILHEHFRKVQLAGIALALAATALIAGG
jgi:drug/metabolite transporter (DMT)-like permease